MILKRTVFTPVAAATDAEVKFQLFVQHDL